MVLTHRRAVGMMVAAALMWSIAGVVTRQLEAARSFEVAFWRSGFNALALVAMLSLLRGPVALWRTLAQGGPALWLSGLCWSVMYSAFMIALTLTSVANVLVTISITPLLTAVAGRALLGQRLQRGSWLAIGLAGLGIAVIYGHDVVAADPRQLWGTAVALAVPVASALNWTLLQQQKGRAGAPDMLAAVLVGAVLSALAMLPLSLPFAASVHDLRLLALLGVVQLAIPCLLAVAAAAVLNGPEQSLLGLLEVVFGVIWAWLGAGEAPSSAVLGGGALVLVALVASQHSGLRTAAVARPG
jgi:drug/metabolite transporter (DMT)-like permease